MHSLISLSVSRASRGGGDNLGGGCAAGAGVRGKIARADGFLKGFGADERVYIYSLVWDEVASARCVGSGCRIRL